MNDRNKLNERLLYFSTSLLGNTEKKTFETEERKKIFRCHSYSYLTDWLTVVHIFCGGGGGGGVGGSKNLSKIIHANNRHVRWQQQQQNDDISTFFFSLLFWLPSRWWHRKKIPLKVFFSGNHNNHIFVCVCVWIIIIWSDTGYPLVYPRRVIWNLPD